MNKQAVFFDLGLRDYKVVWDLQHELVEKRAQDEIPDVLILCEHSHVITLGRRAVSKFASHLRTCELVYGIPCYAVERGGDMTYHGPGQLVGYSIMRLEPSHRGLHRYLRDLEEVLILALGDFGIEAQRRSSYTGVWTARPPPQKKIASIGIAVRRWVTYHGFALNINTNLNFFKQISPCGLDGAIMTSMEQLLQCPIEMEVVKDSVKRHFEEVFDVSLTPELISSWWR